MKNESKTVIYFVVGIVVLIGVFFLISATNNPPAKKTSTNPKVDQSVDQSFMNKINTLSLISIKATNATTNIKSTSVTTTSTKNGKPYILYVGADYCPFCASERWPLIVALSQFGTFSGLKYMTSSSADTYPSTNTLSFYQSTYTSKYLTFEGVETATNQQNNTGAYIALQNMTSDQNNIFNTYNAPPYVTSDVQGSIPFIDFGNKYLVTGSQYDPSVLKGKNWDTIVSDIQNSKANDGLNIEAAANEIIAKICTLTNNQPSNVCL